MIKLEYTPAAAELPATVHIATAVGDCWATETANRLLQSSPDRAGIFALAMHERTVWDPDEHWRRHWQCVSDLLAHSGPISCHRCPHALSAAPADLAAD